MRKIIASAVLLAVCTARADYTAVTNAGAVVFENISGASEITDSYLAEDGISSLTFYVPEGMGNFFFNPALPSTYTGGTLIRRGQTYIARGDVFGTGAVTISNSASIMVDGHDVVLDNKIVFNQDHAYVVGFNSGGRITLKSVGTTGASGTKRIRIGRTGIGAASKATLSLTGADSEELGRIQTSGNLDLTLDGGTIAAAKDAESPFFASATASDTPKATISPAGVTMAVAAGANIELGLSPAFRRDMTTNVLSTAAIPNGDFESNLTGWAIDTSGNTSASGSGVKTAGSSAFDVSGSDDWSTTNTTRYLMMRVNHKLSRTITVPSSGLWRIVFDLGCRPGDNYYSLNMTNIVTVSESESGDIVKSTSFPGPLSKANRWAGFKRFETDIMELAEGTSYKLEVTPVNAKPQDINMSFNYDVFRMEKMEILEPRGMTKTGGGTLHTGAWTGGDVTVEAGTLKVESAAIDGTQMSVDGGTLELTDVSLTEGTEIYVAAAGTLAFTPDAHLNLVANGDFEKDGRRKNITAMNPNGWTITKTVETSLNENGSGLQGNGGNVTASTPWTPAGDSTVYLREDSRLSQTVSVTTAGKYRLSFLKACRNQNYSTTMPLTVTVDGNTVLESASSGYDAFVKFHVDLDLAAGDHAIAFTTGEPINRTSQGAMIFIDDVRLNPVKSQGDIDCGTVLMASGSTLRLDNLNKVGIRDFRVDGAPVRGGRAAAVAAGVTVTGSGRVVFGKDFGSVITVK